MNHYTRIPETKYYAVDNNLDYVELATPKVVDNPHALLAVLKISITTITWINDSGYKNSDSTGEIDILNSALEPIEEFENNNWKFKISHLVSKGWHGNKYTFVASFTDTIGFESKTEEFAIEIAGFIRAYRRFQDLSKYPGYKIAVVQLEKEELAAENIMLKEEIKKLKQDLEDLTEKFSYLA